MPLGRRPKSLASRQRSLFGLAPGAVRPGASDTSNRISALNQIGGLPGAARAGLQSSYASSSPSDPARLAAGIARRAGGIGPASVDPEMAMRRVDITSREAGKATARRKRMAGPTDEQRLMVMASQGNPQAMAMLGMIQENKRAGGELGIRNRGLDIQQELGQGQLGLGRDELAAENQHRVFENKLKQQGLTTGIAQAEADRGLEREKIGATTGLARDRMLGEDRRLNQELASRERLGQIENMTAQQRNMIMQQQAQAEQQAQAARDQLAQEESAWGRSDEGQRAKILGNIDPTGMPGAQDAMSGIFGNSGAPSIPQVPMGESPSPELVQQAVSSVAGLPPEQQMAALQQKGITRQHLMEAMQGSKPSMRDRIGSFMSPASWAASPVGLSTLTGTNPNQLGIFPDQDVARGRISESNKLRKQIKLMLGL